MSKATIHRLDQKLSAKELNLLANFGNPPVDEKKDVVEDLDIYLADDP